MEASATFLAPARVHLRFRGSTRASRSGCSDVSCWLQLPAVLCRRRLSDRPEMIVIDQIMHFLLHVVKLDLGLGTKVRRESEREGGEKEKEDEEEKGMK